MKRCKLMFLVAVIVFSISFQLSAQTSLKPTAEFEGGKLYTFGEFSLVDLHGSYRDMGRQYGHLMRDKLQEFYNSVFMKNLDKEVVLKVTTYEKLSEMSWAWFDAVPQRYKELAYGVSESSGVELDKLLIFATIEYTNILCSTLAAWGEYTSGKPLVFGRNWDFDAYYKDYAKFLTITVFHPQDGSNNTAVIHYAGVFGMVCAPDGINEHGLFLSQNAGTPSGGNLIDAKRRPTWVSLFSFLLDCSTMKQLDAAFHTTNSHICWIVNVADKNDAYSYEWPTYGIKQRTGENNGLLVSTNHFVDTSWGITELGNRWETITRRRNLLALGEKFKGKFDEKKMMEVFDTTIENGGTTRKEYTIYQNVIIPETYKLWLKAPDLQNWTEIPLREFLKR